MLKKHSFLFTLFVGTILFSNCSNKQCLDPQPGTGLSYPVNDTVIYTDLSNVAFPSLLDVQFKNADYGFVAGINGFINKTVDGGKNWADVSLPTSGNIYVINFFDNNLGFVGIGSGEVYKTVDGGSNWTQITTPSSGNNYIEFQFFDANTILAAGGSIIREGVMMKSVDGGTSWKEISIPGSQTIYDLEFLNRTVGFTCGTNNQIYKTTDGGATWIQKTITLTTPASSLIIYGKIKFIDQNTGYCVGFSTSYSENYILKTINGGETWNQLPSPEQTTAQADVYTSMYFDRSGQPFIVGGNVALNTPALITSEDEGAT
ncbi:MAG: WD40/YVTN/BNR-like repeat-containing protein [Cytophaga sp.]|uniref:WD40/YVTN/BNR-like repeat-containing protein n=1 Tax=Cytophaga sp. TaxID=29535 RepID=UPI003F7D6BDF